MSGPRRRVPGDIEMGSVGADVLAEQAVPAPPARAQPAPGEAQLVTIPTRTMGMFWNNQVRVVNSEASRQRALTDLAQAESTLGARVQNADHLSPQAAVALFVIDGVLAAIQQAYNSYHNQTSSTNDVFNVTINAIQSGSPFLLAAIILLARMIQKDAIDMQAVARENANILRRGPR